MFLADFLDFVFAVDFFEAGVVLEIDPFRNRVGFKVFVEIVGVFGGKFKIVLVSGEIRLELHCEI